MTILPPIELPEPPRAPSLRASLRRQPLMLALAVGLLASGSVVVYGTHAGTPVADVALGALLLPGIACSMIWLRYVMRFRVLLATGTPARATVSSTGRYTFVDRDGRQHSGTTSPHREGFATLVYDPAKPAQHQFVEPGDLAE